MNRWRVQLLLLLLWVPFRTTTADLGDVVGLWRWRLMLPAGSSKVTHLAFASIVNAASLALPPSTLPPVVGDVDGDGKADFLWRNAQSGELGVTLSSAPTQYMLVEPGVSLSWEIAALTDTDGDGRADIIWHNTDPSAYSNLAVWRMNGATVGFTPPPSSVDLSWQVVGAGDLNGDRTGDLVWRNSKTGDVAAWLMTNSFAQGYGVQGSVPLPWQIVGAADLDGDTKADLVWRNVQTGDVAVWLMSGVTVRQAPVVAAGVPLEWQIAGLGDLDGDGKADIVWRNSRTGDVAAWLMNGSGVSQGPIVSAGVPLAWQIVAVKDVDGDGKADLVWFQAQTTSLSEWLMNGVFVRQARTIVSNGMPVP